MFVEVLGSFDVICWFFGSIVGGGGFRILGGVSRGIWVRF